jgi:hypothetical protein
MYLVKISGTKYTVTLELDRKDWYLRLKIDKSVENQVLCEELTKSHITLKVQTVLEPILYMLNSVQIQKITQDLLLTAKSLFNEGKSETKTQFHPKPTPKDTMNIPTPYYPKQQEKVKQQQTVIPRQTSAPSPSMVSIKDFNELKELVENMVESHSEMIEKISLIESKLSHLSKITTDLAKITDIILRESK